MDRDREEIIPGRIPAWYLSGVIIQPAVALQESGT